MGGSVSSFCGILDSGKSLYFHNVSSCISNLQYSIFYFILDSIFVNASHFLLNI